MTRFGFCAPKVEGPSDGFASVAALTALVILAAVILSGVGSIFDYSSGVSYRRENHALVDAAESASALAISHMVTDYRAWVASAGRADDVAAADAYLTALAVPDVGSGAEGLDLTSVLGLQFGGDTLLEIGPSDVVSIRALRAGTAADPQVVLRVTTAGRRSRLGGDTGWQRVLETTYDLQLRRWPGMDYAMLANNINCMMCHARIDSAQRTYDLGGGPGSYDRVKIGALETVVLRKSTSSFFAGSMHVAGDILDTSGYPVTDWSSFSLTCAGLSADGKIIESGSGVVSTQAVTDAPSGSSFGSIYRQYGAPEPMVDGELPSGFPPPFRDDGGIDAVSGLPDPAGAGNRVVDANEFHAVTRFFTGSLAGGTIHTVPSGGAVTSAGDLSSALGTATSVSLGSRTEGEVVFLTGTAANPILLNGDIGIDGDVVLQGYVKGRGSLYVSGNVYLPSDVRYLDGSQFGRAADGSENLMGVVAGGSLLVGNVFHPSYGKGDLFGNGTSLPSFSLLMTAEFNRREWAKTQPVLPGAGEDLSNPASWSVTNLLFEGTDYVPRYFRFSSDQPVPIFNKKSHFDPATGTWIGPELAWDWDSNYLNFADPTDPTDPTLFDGAGASIATVQEFTREGGWISDALLKQMMEDALAARSPGPLQFDGALYSSNSIVGIASNYDSSGGELRFRGAVIGADLGLLAPDGLTVLYDDRVRDLLNIRTATAVEFRESTRLLLQ